MRDETEIERQLARQAGVIRHDQLLAAGGTRAFLSAQVKAGRWQRIYRGVYVGYTGPIAWDSRLYAACLWAGDDCAICDSTALALWGLAPQAPKDPIRIAIDRGRVLSAPPGMVVVRRADLARVVHPVRRPPIVRVEDAVLRVASTGAAGPDLGVVFAACRERATTPGRLMDALMHLPRLRHRDAIAQVVDDARGGLHSWLERRYVHSVERAHRLPAPHRQVRSTVDGHSIWRDALYPQWAVALEIDGAEHHGSWAARGRDRRRDLVAAGQGLVTVRVGYHEVVNAPCQTAASIGVLLGGRGWHGELARCGPDCVALSASQQAQAYTKANIRLQQ